VFAAFLKLIIPFIVCIPGIIAFTLYAGKMQENAMNLDSLNKPVLKAFEETKGQPATAQKVFPFDGDFAELHPERAAEIYLFNLEAVGVEVPQGATLAEVWETSIEYFAEKNPKFQRKLEEMKDFNKKRKPEEPEKKVTLTDLNNEAVNLWPGQKMQKLVGYDYDGAFPLLIRYLTPHGLRGFVLAALMGAVISSLASMLNAASTIFTMDIYREWFNKKAAQSALVWVGRCCVPIGVIIGCLIAPVLANPRFKGAFAYIQEFQGFVSPGVLTIFLFGLFVKWTPRYCGVLGLILSPIIYGILFFGWGDMAFLNRMGITVGAIAAVLLLVTLIRPMRERIVLPEQTKIELNWSKGSVYFGLFVTLLTVVLYIIFW